MLFQGSTNRLSRAGKWGFFVALLMAFSFRADFRFEIAGLLVHPFLLMLPLAYLFSGFQISNIPARVSVPLLLFYFVFSIACFRNVNPLSEIFKVGASVATFFFFAFAIKSERDFKWIGWALILCAVCIGILGFWAGEETESLGDRLSGINVLEGIGNKNAQSLFTLPGVFICSYFLISAIAERRLLQIFVLVIFLFFIVVSIFLSANRSGWLGLAIILLSLFFVKGFGPRTIVFSLILVVLSYIAIDLYAAKIFERKRFQTTHGYKSDEGRKMLMINSLAVGFEHPLLGVGMDELHHQMAVRLGLVRYGLKEIDTHFLPGYLFGSSGLLCFALFYVFLAQLVRRYQPSNRGNRAVKEARVMLIFFVILFVIRSFFSRELLYSPTFVSGMGILCGYYLLQVRLEYLATRD